MTTNQISEIISTLETAIEEHQDEIGSQSPLIAAAGEAIGALRILSENRLTIAQVVELAAHAGHVPASLQDK